MSIFFILTLGKWKYLEIIITNNKNTISEYYKVKIFIPMNSLIPISYEILLKSNHDYGLSSDFFVMIMTALTYDGFRLHVGHPNSYDVYPKADIVSRTSIDLPDIPEHER